MDEQLTAAERAEAQRWVEATQPGKVEIWTEADCYTVERLEPRKEVIASFPIDCSGEGDYDDYNRRQFANAALLVVARTYLPRVLAALDAETQAREAAEARTQELIQAFAATEHEIQQTLGKALGYPDFPEPGSGYVCVADHVAASLAMEAATRIEEAEAEAGRLRMALAQVCRECRNCYGSGEVANMPCICCRTAREALRGEGEDG